VALLGRLASPEAGAGLVAVTSWGLAEYFTRRRRMALPSILFLFAFVGSVFLFALLVGHDQSTPRDVILLPFRVAIAAALAAGAAFAHWRRFMVPITPAVGTVAAVGTVIALLLTTLPDLREHVPPLLLLGGLGAFALAMHWDMSDVGRSTRRTDVAFWLHLAAAPMIIHPAFSMLGLSPFRIWAPHAVNHQLDPVNAVIAIAIYVGLAMLALAIDRRALLVSALIYVLVAISALFEAAGSITSSFALTALVIGSALLLLSAFWHPTRRMVVVWLPATVRCRLPAAA
jgi:hypothetical protein